MDKASEQHDTDQAGKNCERKLNQDGRILARRYGIMLRHDFERAKLLNGYQNPN